MKLIQTKAARNAAYIKRSEARQQDNRAAMLAREALKKSGGDKR